MDEEKQESEPPKKQSKFRRLLARDISTVMVTTGSLAGLLGVGESVGGHKAILADNAIVQSVDKEADSKANENIPAAVDTAHRIVEAESDVHNALQMQGAKISAAGMGVAFTGKIMGDLARRRKKEKAEKGDEPQR